MAMLGRGARAARVVTVAVAALLVSGCATKRDVRDLNSAIQDLALREDSLLAQLRSESAVTRDTLRGQSSQIVDFRGAISYQLKAISQRLDQLAALVGQNQRDLAAVRDQLANRSVGAPGGAVAPTNDSSTSVLPGVSAAPGSTATTGAEAEALYNTSVRKYHQGLLATARAGFQDFLGAYPNHPLAPEVHFDLGDVLEQQGDTTKALAQFRLILSNFPTASKAGDAMYRIALIELARKQIRDARTTLQRIVNTYPGTAVAGLAKAKLAAIR